LVESSVRIGEMWKLLRSGVGSLRDGETAS
jgi:hypothetical protein